MQMITSVINQTKDRVVINAESQLSIQNLFKFERNQVGNFFNPYFNNFCLVDNFKQRVRIQAFKSIWAENMVRLKRKS